MVTYRVTSLWFDYCFLHKVMWSVEWTCRSVSLHIIPVGKKIWECELDISHQISDGMIRIHKNFLSFARHLEFRIDTFKCNFIKSLFLTQVYAVDCWLDVCTECIQSLQSCKNHQNLQANKEFVHHQSDQEMVVTNPYRRAWWKQTCKISHISTEVDPCCV